MSEENVQIVRRVWEASERGDSDTVFALYDPAMVWDQSTLSGPVTGIYRGHEGVRRVWREWLDAFETHHASAETFIDAGDAVVVGYRLGGRGKTSGVEVEARRWNVYRIRNGLVIRVDLFETKAKALEAAGLPEDTHASPE